MSSNFELALSKIRAISSNPVEQGTAFEKLSKIYFENDDIQKQELRKIWFYKDWAKLNPDFSKVDIGIDLVGELKKDKGLVAIQCKFFKSDHQISKEDLDSFISASANEVFKRLILIDTSNEDLGSNAQSMINNLDKSYQRIQKYDLENSRLDWLEYVENDKIKLSKKKEPLDHQIKAVEEAKNHFTTNNRGKMIMACGTGKTYTSLKIAEAIANKKLVLYMVPSLALMSQSIREWKNDCNEDFIAFSACSDQRVGRINNESDYIQVKLNELAIPATTDPKKLSYEISRTEKNKMTVVFSTYQSIEVIKDAQKKYNMKSFDLIICDEAHRTTGATFENEDDSYFVRIHDNNYVEGKKRLYMTATPRIYGNKAKRKADEGRVELASMDDAKKFGKEFFNRGFNWAVENNLLSDYKVVILAIDENMVSANLQKSLEDGSELKLTDATKIIGVYKALAKVGFDKKKDEKLKPIKKALAFSQNIEISKIFQKEFNNVINEYIANENIKEENKVDLTVETQHVDGSFNADRRTNSLNWLKSDTEKNTCRILSNVKCLSEGVDVPSLDAIMFLHPKKSQIDVVQAVGRVMRKAEGKNIGYVIIPVTVAPGISPEKALNDNEKYKVVWQIVNALRTHDERLDSKVNMLSLGEDVSDKIDIIHMSAEQDATTAKIEDVSKKNSKKDQKKDDEIVNTAQNIEDPENKKSQAEQMSLQIDDLSQAIKAKIVQKCGTRDYWENWATDIAKIAETHVNKLNSLLVKKNSKERKVFETFLTEIRDDLNPEISETDAIEMLAQHIITKPVFETLFSGNDFSKENAVSKAIEKVLSQVYKTNIEKENISLKNFYSSVRRRAKDIITPKSKTVLLNELYERFFKNAFPLTTQKLGIVYTPVEIVDFMINSINGLLIENFNKKLEDKNIHILDPFTGTGTFITRLLQSGLISNKNISNKYLNELHANEVVLLAYYVAGINIESVYQTIKKENQYKPFNGIVLTDTFQLYEQERDMFDDLMPDNSQKRTKQKKRDITVVMGNPPYSVGQTAANDNAQNLKYLNLDEKIKSTYAKYTKATNKGSLYDSYIRAFRWASDRIKDDGIISFVTNANWVEANAMDGMRKSVHEDFSKIIVVNLRGNQRTSGELSKKEGGKVFGGGSRTPIAITFLIKNSKSTEKNKIYYYDIGDYLDRKEKLKKIENIGSIKSLFDRSKFKKIIPDDNNDWINQGKKDYRDFISLGTKDKNNKEIKIFKDYSSGFKTSRDSWNYNFSKKNLKNNVTKSIDFYNQELNRYNKSKKDIKPINFVDKDHTKITWERTQIQNIEKNKPLQFKEKSIQECFYRPFTKLWGYTDEKFNSCVYQMPKIFPNNKEKNLVIIAPGTGNRNEFSTYISDKIPDLGFLSACYCFPLKIFSKIDEGLFNTENSYDAITDDVLKLFKTKLKLNSLKKEEIFYYIYGLFHSAEYRNKYKNNLNKEIPRIPISKNFKNFYEIGKKLANIHLNIDDIEENKDVKVVYDINDEKNKNFFTVEKMIFKGKRNNLNKDTIIYNQYIKIENIPLSSYKYVINGKSAIEWVMERQRIVKNDVTKIINNANDYASETIKDPKYPLKLLLKVISLSIETQKLINKLPKL